MKEQRAFFPTSFPEGVYLVALHTHVCVCICARDQGGALFWPEELQRVWGPRARHVGSWEAVL